MIARASIIILSFVFSMVFSFYFIKYYTMYNEIVISDEMIQLAKVEADSQENGKVKEAKYEKYLEALFVSRGEVSNFSRDDGSILTIDPSGELLLKRERYVKSINELERRKMKNGLIAIVSSIIFFFSSISFFRRKHKVTSKQP